MTSDEDIGLMLSIGGKRSATESVSAQANENSLEAILGIAYPYSSNESTLNKGAVATNGNDATAPNTLYSGSHLSSENPSHASTKRLGAISGLTMFAPDNSAARQSSQNHNLASNVPAVVTVRYTEKEKRERRYECEYCRKRFSRPSSLTSHVYTHTGERPFACDFPGCIKRFSVPSNLRRHYKVHTNRRPGRRSQPPSHESMLTRSLFPGHYMDSGTAATNYTDGIPLSSTLSPMPQPMNIPESNRDFPVLLGWGNLHSAPISACKQPGYAPSVRATALSQELNRLPLLSSIVHNSTTPSSPSFAAPALHPSVPSCSSTASSPDSGQSMRPSNPPSSATSNLGQGLTAAQIQEMLSSSPLAYTGATNTTNGQVMPASRSLQFSFDTNGEQVPEGASGNDATSIGAVLAATPAIATPAILTNSSVTTKAMNGAIEPQVSTDLSLDRPKTTLLGLLALADQQPRAEPSLPEASSGLSTQALLDCLSSSDSSAPHSPWHYAQTQCSQSL